MSSSSSWGRGRGLDFCASCWFRDRSRRRRRPPARRHPEALCQRGGSSSTPRPRSCCWAPMAPTLLGTPVVPRACNWIVSCTPTPRRPDLQLNAPRDLYVAVPRHRRRTGSTPLTSQGARRLAGCGADEGLHRLGDQPHRDRRLRRVQEADRRRSAGSRSTCPKPIQLEPLRLPASRAAAVRGVEGLALREGHAAHGRPARAHLLAHPREPARSGARTTSTRARAPAAGDPGGRRSKLAGVGTLPGLARSSAATSIRPLATDLTAGELHPARLGPVPLRQRRAALHCRLGGDPEYVDGQGGDSSRTRTTATVISMFTGESAPQPPPPGLERVRAGLRDRQQALPRGTSLAGYVSAVFALFSAGLVGGLRACRRRPCRRRRPTSRPCACRARSRSSRSPIP